MKGRWQITVRQEFSAAHALRNYHGKCERQHGHNFKVTVTVEGEEPSPETGLILDFRTLKLALAEALAALDHQMLNEITPFDHINPSSENIAQYLWQNIQRLLASSNDPQASKVCLARVAVSEKNSQEAAYLGEV